MSEIKAEFIERKTKWTKRIEKEKAKRIHLFLQAKKFEQRILSVNGSPQLVITTDLDELNK